MADAFLEKFNAIGERLKVGGSDLSRKMTAGMNTVSGKVKELFQGPTQADKLVEEATAENLRSPDWAKNMELCDMVNSEQMSGQDVVRALKKRLMIKNVQIQLLTLSLFETCVKNCEKMFSEVASERVLDEMVKIVDDPQTPAAVRDKTLKMIESWGESTEELRYLPVFEETYKSLKSRGIKFPGRDVESLAPIFTPPQSVSAPPAGTHTTIREAVGLRDTFEMSSEYTKEMFDVARNSVELLSTVLTSSPQQEVLQEELTLTLVEQCRQSQFTVQRIVERAGENEALLFETLSVNDELQQVLTKYEDMLTATNAQPSQTSEPALIPVGVVDEEEMTPAGGDSLKRNHSSKPQNFHSVQGEDDMADFDAVIFGRTDGHLGEESSQGPTKKKNDDLISF